MAKQVNPIIEEIMWSDSTAEGEAGEQTHPTEQSKKRFSMWSWLPGFDYA